MRPYDLILYALVIFGWSTSWYPLSLQVGVVAPEVSLVWRFGAATLVMFVITRLSGTRLTVPWREHLRLIILGMTLFSFNFAFFYYASLYAASGLLAVLLSTVSLVNVLMVAMLNRAAPSVSQVAAALTGITGLVLIFWPELEASDTATLAILFCTAGMLLFSFGNMLSSALQTAGIPVLTATSWGMLYGTIGLLVVSLLRGHAMIIDPGLTYMGSLVWLILISSVLTFYCYLSLIGRIGPGRAAYAAVVFPVFALLISARYEDYEWSVLALVGLVFVILGNVIMIRARD